MEIQILSVILQAFYIKKHMKKNFREYQVWALITGAASGMGRIYAVRLAEMGYNLILVDINGAGLSETENTVMEKIQADLSLSAEMKQRMKIMNIVQDLSAIDAAETIFGKVGGDSCRLEVLVNNAGITKDKLMIGMSEDDFMEVINTNLKGSFLCMQMVSKLMIKQRYGRIINLSSVTGVYGNAGQVNYAASKAGVIVNPTEQKEIIKIW